MKLVHQEREKSGTKKYPVEGIFGGKEKNAREREVFWVAEGSILIRLFACGIPAMVFPTSAE